MVMPSLRHQRPAAAPRRFPTAPARRVICPIWTPPAAAPTRCSRRARSCAAPPARRAGTTPRRCAARRATSSSSGRPRSNSSRVRSDLEAHQLGEGRREAAAFQVVVAVAEAAAVLLGQVDAADVEIAAHVLPEIGELQGGADVIGQGRPRLVERLAEVKHQPPDRVGGAAAIVEQLIERLVSLDDAGPARRRTSRSRNGSRRDAESLDGRLQGDEDRVGGPAVVAGQQLIAPPARGDRGPGRRRRPRRRGRRPSGNRRKRRGNGGAGGAAAAARRR